MVGAYIVLTPIFFGLVDQAYQHADYAARATHQVSHELPSAEDRVAYFTLLLFIGTAILAAFTAGLFWVTYRALREGTTTSRRQAHEFAEQLAVAEKAANAATSNAQASIQAMEFAADTERAYILPVIDEGSVVDLIRDFDHMIDWASDHIGEVVLRFSMSNFGKTPGTILQIQAGLYLAEKPDELKHHFASNPVLAAGDGTEGFFEVTMSLHPSEAAWLAAPIDLEADETDGFTFEGMVYFQDVFRRAHTEYFVWRYNRRHRKLIPMLFPRTIRTR
ncbi:MAG: hypothetical protein WAU68_11215 [Vitreimonas sp.]